MGLRNVKWSSRLSIFQRTLFLRTLVPRQKKKKKGETKAKKGHRNNVKNTVERSRVKLAFTGKYTKIEDTCIEDRNIPNTLNLKTSLVSFSRAYILWLYDALTFVLKLQREV